MSRKILHLNSKIYLMTTKVLSKQKNAARTGLRDHAQNSELTGYV